MQMFGGTLLSLVWKCSKSFALHIANEFVKMNIEDIVHLMESAGALQKKVEVTKETILDKIRNQVPFVLKMPPAPSTLTPVDEALAVAQELNVEPISVVTVALLPLQIRTGVFQVGKSSKFQKETGFFDVSQDSILPSLQRSR